LHVVTSIGRRKASGTSNGLPDIRVEEEEAAADVLDCSRIEESLIGIVAPQVEHAMEVQGWTGGAHGADLERFIEFAILGRRKVDGSGAVDDNPRADVNGPRIQGPGDGQRGAGIRNGYRTSCAGHGAVSRIIAICDGIGFDRRGATGGIGDY